MAVGFGSRTFQAVRSIFGDALYRGSLILLANTVVLAGFGFGFWTLAAHSYHASALGVFSGVTSGVGLLAAIAELGLQNTMTRHLASAEYARELVAWSLMAIATVGGALCLATTLILGLLGPHLPPSLDLRQRGTTVVLVTALVVLTAISGTLDAGLVATRASHALLIKNLVGSAVKVGALVLLSAFGSTGLLGAYSLGLILATGLSAFALPRRLGGAKVRLRSPAVVRHYWSMTPGSYFASIAGIIPVTIVPLQVLAMRGAAETAHFSIAFMITGFLYVIPSTVAQVFFAEASRKGALLGIQLRKSLRGIYGLLLPSVAILVAAAPLVLRIFGASYASETTSCLRVLALSALPMGGTYMVDSVLIARDRITAYAFMNWANAAIVLGCVRLLLPRGLTAAAAGWTASQVLVLFLGFIVLATGRAGRHSRAHGAESKDAASPHQVLSHRQLPELAFEASEPQIRALLAAWPTMPTTMIAERIGWDQSVGALLGQVSELRSSYLHSRQPVSRTVQIAGEVAQCGFWFPPVEVPVGFGQIRSGAQLPVLTMITGYSHWLTAVLIPSTQHGDLFAAWWQLLKLLGAVPRVLTWDSEKAIGYREAGEAQLTSESMEFCRVLGAKVIIGSPGDPDTRGVIERAHAYLERSFLPGRTFVSPMHFNEQLSQWLASANTRHRRLPNRSPAELIAADRHAMLPLPGTPPAIGWRMPIQIGNQPFIRFDSNDYRIPPALIGRRVELVADLSHIWVLWDGRVAIEHERTWARGQTIGDLADITTMDRRRQPDLAWEGGADHVQ